MLLALLFMLMVSGPAAAQLACDDRTTILKMMEKGFGKVPAARGIITGSDRIMELLVSEDGAWAMLMSTPAGTSCLMMVGENWQDVPPAKRGPGI